MRINWLPILLMNEEDTERLNWDYALETIPPPRRSGTVTPPERLIPCVFGYSRTKYPYYRLNKDVAPFGPERVRELPEDLINRYEAARAAFETVSDEVTKYLEDHVIWI